MKKAMKLASAAMACALALAGCGSSSASSTAASSEAAAASTAESAPAESAAEDASESTDAYASWPEKDITIIYNTKAGTSGDTFLRQIAKALEAEDVLNGHSIKIENVVDSTGAVAWGQVRDAEPDGYTLAMLSPKIVTADLVNNVDLKYTDLTYLAGMGNDPQYLFCKADAPYDTLEELLEYAKDNVVSVGVSSPTGQSLVGMLALEKATGVEFNRITYSSGSEQVVALLGDFIQVGVIEYTDIAGQVEAGELKLLANMASSGVEGVPTFKECGIDITIDRPRGIAGPLNMDPALANRITEVFSKAFDNADYVAYMEASAMEPHFMDAEEYRAAIESLAQVIRDNIDLLNE